MVLCDQLIIYMNVLSAEVPGPVSFSTEVWESAEADASAMSKMATDCGPLSASIRPLKPAAQPIAKNSGCVLDSIY